MDSKKGQPNSVAALVDQIHKRARVFIELKQRDVIADQMPCRACGGRGALIKKIKFLTFGEGTPTLKTRQGKDIVAYDVCDCPACLGIGIDQEAALQFIKQQAI